MFCSGTAMLHLIRTLLTIKSVSTLYLKNMVTLCKQNLKRNIQIMRLKPNQVVYRLDFKVHKSKTSSLLQKVKINLETS